MGGGGAMVNYSVVPGGPPAARDVLPHVPKSLTHSRQPHGVDERISEYLRGENKGRVGV